MNNSCYNHLRELALLNASMHQAWNTVYFISPSLTHTGKVGILDADVILHILTSLDTSRLPCMSALLQLTHTAWGWQSLVPWRLEPFSRPPLSSQAGPLVLTPPKHLRILMNYHATGPGIWHPKRQLKGPNEATWHHRRVTFPWCKLWPVGKASPYLSLFSSLQWTGLIRVPGRHISADYSGSVPPCASLSFFPLLLCAHACTPHTHTHTHVLT